jgi:uncharacterized protein YeaO (DUF488 family)
MTVESLIRVARIYDEVGSDDGQRVRRQRNCGSGITTSRRDSTNSRRATRLNCPKVAHCRSCAR